jgi:hypothetical protein
MKIKNFFKHMGIVMAGILILLGIPFLMTDYGKSFFRGGAAKTKADTVSSASVIIDQPSGKYIIFINRDMHTDEENLNTWISFFRGEEISYLFEDISCSVIKGDEGAITMAQSFQSRLPEKQMSIRTEDASLLMSRADHGLYDIIILSREYAESYHAVTAEGEHTVLIERDKT